MNWTRNQTALLVAFGAIFLIAWTAIFAGALVDWVEIETGRGGSIDFSLRVFFAYANGLVVFSLAFFLVKSPDLDTRVRFLASSILAVSLILLTIWIFDRLDFTHEKSTVRFATTISLIGASAAAMINALFPNRMDGRHRLATVFWTLLAFAFLAGSIDEYFAVHEWVGSALAPAANPSDQSHQIIQDGVTILYALGAVLFVAIFFRVFRAELMRPEQLSGWALLSGVALFVLAVANDTFDYLAEAMFPLSNPGHAMNFAEEMLELTAAALFFCASSISIYENRSEVFPASASKSATRRSNNRIISLIFMLLVIGYLLVPVGIRLTLPKDPYAYASLDQFTATIWADASDGLDSIDEILYVKDHGLIVGNEGTGEVLVFDENGMSAPLVTGLVSPDGLAFSRDTLYVTDDTAGEVREYSMNGDLLGISRDWLSPEGIAVGASGEIYVADLAMRLVARVEQKRKIPIATAIDGLRSPEQLAIDPAGNLYIADERARAIFRYVAGSTVDRFAAYEDGIGIPQSILVHGDYLYVVDSSHSQIHRIGPNRQRDVYISFAKKHNLSAFAFDSSGNMYVAITSEMRAKNVILRFMPEHASTSYRPDTGKHE